MKLFVLVRRDLLIEDQAVQAGHAVGQWCLTHSGAGWNGTLIYLHVADERALRVYADMLAERGMAVEVFHDADFDDEATALAVCDYRAAAVLKKLPLMKF